MTADTFGRALPGGAGLLLAALTTRTGGKRR